MHGVMELLKQRERKVIRDVKRDDARVLAHDSREHREDEARSKAAALPQRLVQYGVQHRR